MDVVDALFQRDTIRLPPGRVEFCSHAISNRLRPDERATLGPVAKEAEDAGHRGYDLFITRENAKNAIFSEDAQSTNTALDHASSGVFNYLDLLARMFAAGTERGDRARRLLASLFPRSLKPVTSASYPEERSAVRRILEVAKGERAADVAAVAGLPELLAELEARFVDFEAALERDKPSAPSYVEAEAAAAEADRRMMDLVHAIQFVYRGDSPEAAARRTELLAPYVDQQQAMRQRYRRKLPPVDVDPTTGEEPPADVPGAVPVV